MHEMSLAEGILQVVEEYARKEGFTRVKTVRVEIGRLSHVEPEALSFCFDAVMRDSIAAGARLEILTVPGRGWCHGCGQEVAMEALYDPCPRCGGFQVVVTGGDEMRIKDLEVD